MPQPPLPFPEPGPSDEASRDLWFARRADGQFRARDEARFQAWLRADEAHRRAFQGWQEHWDLLGRLPAEGLDILRANLADDLAAEARRRAPASSPRRRFLVPAFSMAAAAVAGTLAWRQWDASPVFSQQFSTLRGQQADITLPDGSRVRLDTATRLEVVYYRHRRALVLPEGQAVFSVTPDAERPFDVLAGPLRITVVGTRFAVRHTPGIAGDDGVRVAVEEGRVRVERVGADPAAPPVLLGPAEAVAGDAAGVLGRVSRVSSAGIAPWRDSRVSFNDTRLDQALAELERYGDTGLVVRDPAVAALRVTGTFNPQRLDSFVRVLPQAAPVRLRRVDGATEIVRE